MNVISPGRTLFLKCILAYNTSSQLFSAAIQLITFPHGTHSQNLIRQWAMTCFAFNPQEIALTLTTFKKSNRKYEKLFHSIIGIVHCDPQ